MLFRSWSTRGRWSRTAWRAPAASGSRYSGNTTAAPTTISGRSRLLLHPLLISSVPFRSSNISLHYCMKDLLVFWSFYSGVDLMSPKLLTTITLSHLKCTWKRSGDSGVGSGNANAACSQRVIVEVVQNPPFNKLTSYTAQTSYSCLIKRI